MSDESGSEDDEETGTFLDNDGLTSRHTPTEKAETSKYLKIYLLAAPLIGQLLAWPTYFLSRFIPGQAGLYQQKFAFISTYQLGYVFLAVGLLRLTRGFMVALANGARAPTRVDRPDQHVYRIKPSDSNPLWDEPFVLMASDGAAGRFNRAQRAVFNTDETLPLFVAETLLAGSVFGPITLAMLLLVICGRCRFSCLYRGSAEARGAGFVPALVGELWMSGLLWVCAIQGIFYPWISRQ